MKKITISAIILIVLGAGFYVLNQKNGPALVTYTDQQHHFVFQYPANWSICKTSNETEVYVEISNNCSLLSNNSNDPGEKLFLIRNVGERNMSFLKSGALKPDTGWTKSQNSESFGRNIFYADKDLSIAMLGAETDRAILDRLASTFSSNASSISDTPIITGGYFDVATGATFNGRISLEGKNLDQLVKIRYQVPSSNEILIADRENNTITTTPEGTKLQFMLPGNYVNENNATVWVQTAHGLSNGIMVYLTAKGDSFKLIQ